MKSPVSVFDPSAFPLIHHPVSGPMRRDLRRVPRSKLDPRLSMIGLRHQIAGLKRNQTCRPCLRRSDRLLWILMSRCWPEWRESLTMFLPEPAMS
jgi:hypothetical protein